MSRLSRALIIGALLLASAAGCGGTPPGGPSPSASTVATSSPGSPTTAPTTPAADPWMLSTEGIGPYRLGARSDELQAAGLLGESTPVNSSECPELYSVAATGAYAGTLLLVLRHNVLIEIGTAGGKTVRSPAGITVGSTFEEATTAYGSAAVPRTGANGLRGLVVSVGDRVLLFTGHPIRPGIGWFSAGYANHTEATFLSGNDC